jgi:dynein heavy chain 1
MALRGCKEAVRIPEVNLKQNVLSDIDSAMASLHNTIGAEKESAKEELMLKFKSNEEVKNAMCNSILSWHRELNDLFVRFDRQLSSDDVVPLQERDFWMRMERTLTAVDEQARLPGVQLTLEMVKRLKIRGHIPKQFEEDTATLQSKLDTAQKYCILMKDLPVTDMQSATDVASLGAAIVRVFDHIKKHLVRSRYPVARAVKLLEAISREFKNQLHQLIRALQLMHMPFAEFLLLFGDLSHAKRTRPVAKIDSSVIAGAAESLSCRDLFDVWDAKESEFLAEATKLGKYSKDWRSDSDKLSAAHRDLMQHLQDMVRFRRDHESLLSVMLKVARAASGAGAGSLKRAMETLNKAYQRVCALDIVDVSGSNDAWNAATREYRQVADNIQDEMASNLRKDLEAAKTSDDMLQILTIFSPLLVRPKIRCAIQEYQNKLISQVKDDVHSLEEKFRKKFSNSEAEKMMCIRGIPPVAGSIIWARQVERHLQVYMQRIKHVVGEGWQDHPEAHKLGEECEAFRAKLDASIRFRQWQEEVLRMHR